MKRGLILLAAASAVVLAACTGTSGTPTPLPQTAGATSTTASASGTSATSATPSSSSPTDTTSPSSATADDPALDRCDDLGVLPCARQVNRVTLPIAGSSIALVYSSDRQPGRTVDAAPAAANVGLGGWSLSNLPGYDPATKREVLPDGTVRTVTGVVQGDLTAVADPSGSTVTTFDAQGRAAATLDAVTGLPVARFTWDEHGLATVTDASGATLTVGRDSAGVVTSLQSTGTSPMTFAFTNGQLAAVGYPDGGTVQLDGGIGGLLADVTDASGLRTTFGYDVDGRLTSRSDPTGTTTTYERHVADGTATVVTSRDGTVIGTDTVAGSGAEATFTHTDATGLTTTVVSDGTTRTITAAQRSTTVTLSPDPRWGTDAPVPTSVAVAEGSSAGPTIGVTRSGGGTTGSTVSVDGRIWTYAYDSTTRTTTVTDPNGASRATAVDENGRIVTTMVQGVPVSYAYDDNGRVTKITIGTGADARTWIYAYAPGSITVTDPMGNSTRETIGATGRVTGVAGPNGTGYTTTLDTAGRITGFAENGAGTYSVTWGANGLPAVENAPDGQGSPQFTSTTYDGGAQPATRATADSTVTYGRDAAGRVTTIDAGGNSSIALTYDTAGRLATAATPGVTLTQTYTGSALTSSATSLGGTKTEIGRAADGLGRTTSLTVNGGASISYAYDPAGNVTTAGAMTITRDPTTDWITTKKLGVLTETFRYNQFGEPTAITVTGPSGPLASITEQRDHLGRVTSRTTTTGATHHTTTYRYDAAGRLTGETADGKATTYGYDAAGNLTSVKSPTGTTINTYDARNTLLRSGTTTFTYDGWGRLATAKGPDGTTTYHYDALGNLTGVDRPGKPAITYSLDGLGRRVASASGGTTGGMIAYLDPIRPVATFTATGAVDEVYVYDGDLQPANINDGGGTLPAYLTKGGTAYLELPDVSGGPALVIDSATGAIADAIDRTATGSVRSETDPGFQVIGFGGGIADPATGLVKIGARDYDTATGRWTAPDPLGMAGGSANLYTYVSGDPVNRTDPRGTCDYVGIGISAGVGLGPVAGGGGVGVAWAGGQFGTYSTVSGGGGLVGDLGIGVTVTCLNSDNGDTSLGNFSGTGSFSEGTAGPASGGSDTGYDSSGNQSSHGGHGTVSFGGGFGGSVQGALTSIVCLTGCPPPPGPTVCGDLGCDSSPGKSPGDPSSGSGSGGIPTSGPRSTGDPHIRTADGSRYDMMAVGEFVWARTDSGDLVVQIRQQPLAGTRTISMNTAIAILVDGDKLEFAPPATSGDPVAMSAVGAVIPPVGTFQLAGGTRVMRTPTLTTVTAKDSTEFWIRMNPSGLDIVGAFPDALKGKVHGLVGPFTGADTQKVETSAGKAIAIADLSDYSTLYRTFADSWRIKQADSLFTDRPGKDATAFDDPTFPDRVPPVVPGDDAAAAKAACVAAGLTGADLTDCEFDVGNTSDAGYAAAMTASSGVIPGAAPTSAPGGPTGSVTGDIVPGQTVSGTVAPNAKKSYNFHAPAGTVAYFAANPSCADTAAPDVVWNLADATGSPLVGSSVICNDLGRAVFPKDGSYSLVVANSGSTSEPFSVTWEASRPDQIKQLQPGQTSSGTIDKPGARDLWTVTVPAGTVAYLAGDPSCDHLNLLWNVQAADGSQLVGSSYTCNDLGRLVFDKAGTYQVMVASADGRTAPYQFTWEVSRPDQVKPLQSGQTASGSIDKPGAQDVWTMTMSAGTVVYLAADPACDKSTANAMTWNVQDETGASLVGSSYICSDLGRIEFDKAGTYRIVVASSDGKTGDYSVTWKASRPDQTKPLGAGETASGVIDKPGAQDFWAMTVSAATVVNLVADPSCDATTETNLTWSVVSADGSSVVGSSYICTDLGAVKLPAAGTYRVEVSSSSGGTGSYSFRWTS